MLHILSRQANLIFKLDNCFYYWINGCLGINFFSFRMVSKVEKIKIDDESNGNGNGNTTSADQDNGNEEVDNSFEDEEQVSHSALN